jgi:hypothetical protein
MLLPAVVLVSCCCLKPSLTFSAGRRALTSCTVDVVGCSKQAYPIQVAPAPQPMPLTARSPTDDGIRRFRLDPGVNAFFRPDLHCHGCTAPASGIAGRRETLGSHVLRIKQALTKNLQPQTATTDSQLQISSPLAWPDCQTVCFGRFGELYLATVMVGRVHGLLMLPGIA